MPQFLRALNERTRPYEAFDVGLLLAILVLEAQAEAPQSRREAILANLAILGQHLSNAGVAEDIRNMLVGAHDVIVDWSSD